MAIILKVQPDVLVNKANEMATEKASINSIMDECKASVNSLQSAWESEASTEYQAKFKGVYDDIDSVLAIVQQYITNLTQAAEIYRTGENAAKGASEGLPTEGVFKN